MSQKDTNFGNTCERDKKKILKDINEDSRPFPSKREYFDSDGNEPTMKVEIALLQSIDKRLAKLQILDVMREELGELRASQEYSQMQIDDLMSENVELKCSIRNCGE